MRRRYRGLGCLGRQRRAPYEFLPDVAAIDGGWWSESLMTSPDESRRLKNGCNHTTEALIYTRPDIRTDGDGKMGELKDRIIRLIEQDAA